MRFLVDAFYQGDVEYIKRVLQRYHTTNTVLEELSYMCKRKYDVHDAKSPLLAACRTFNIAAVAAVMGMDDFDVNAAVDREGTHIISKLISDMESSAAHEDYVSIIEMILQHPRIVQSTKLSKEILKLHDASILNWVDTSDTRLLEYYINTLMGTNAIVISKLMGDADTLRWDLCLNLKTCLKEAETLCTTKMFYMGRNMWRTYQRALLWNKECKRMIHKSYTKMYQTIIMALRQYFNEDLAIKIADEAMNSPRKVLA